MPTLRMDGIAKRFGPTVALSGVSLRVEPGEVLALIGENGAGKSTLMKVLAGVIAPDTGTMTIDGKPYEPSCPTDARRAGVGMIHQEGALAPHLSVAENIVLGVEPTFGPFVNRARARRVASEALERLGHGDMPLGTPAGRLSPGQQQLVEIARTLATGCGVIILDEPTSSLPGADVERLLGLLRRLRDEGRSIIYISHALEEVRAVADRLTVLRDGASVGEGSVAQTPTAKIVAMMVGREVKELYPRSARTPGEEVLRVEGVSGPIKPVGATLSLRRGEVLGIAGLVGAGRTELLRCIFGLERVRTGSVRVAAMNARGQLAAGGWRDAGEPRQLWAAGLGMVSEDRRAEGLALNLSIGENMCLPSLPMFVSGGFYDGRAGAWMRRLGVKARSHTQQVGRLSGGNQQKVAIARLLQAEVDVLLLDEPTRGIDVGAKAEIYRLIDELAAGGQGRRPMAVLMVSSYLPELMGVCDRLAVMARGRLGPARPIGAVDEHAVMHEATGGALPDDVNDAAGAAA